MKRSLKKCQRGLLVWYYSGPGRLGRRGGCRASAGMSILKARRRRSRLVIADSQLEFREFSEEVVFSSGAVWSIQYIMWAYRAFSAFSSQRSIQLLSILPNTFFSMARAASNAGSARDLEKGHDSPEITGTGILVAFACPCLRKFTNV